MSYKSKLLIINRDVFSSFVGSSLIFIALFLLTRQGQISYTEGMAAPFAIVFLAITLRWSFDLIVFLPLLLYCSVSALFAVWQGVDPANTFRFWIILGATALAFHAKIQQLRVWSLTPLIAQAILVLALSLYLAFLSDSSIANEIRSSVIASGMGDVYSFDGLYYRVQLLGNALLPIIFLISYFRRGDSLFFNVLFYLGFLALVAAGNLTYFIMMLFAFAVKNYKTFFNNYRGIIYLFLFMGFSFSVILLNFDYILQTKFDGASSSMGVRLDQISVTLNEIGVNNLILIFGSGLGSSFPDGLQRNYSASNYIELQSLYIFYQIGLIGFFIYLVTIIFVSFKTLESDGLKIFWLYILSGLSNPYILDTNQIVATFVLLGFYSKNCKLARFSLDSQVAFLVQRNHVHS